MMKALRYWLALGLILALTVGSAAGESTLRVYGKGGAGDWDNPRFAALYPDVRWEGGDELGVYDVSDLVTVLLTREAYDLYAVPYANCHFEAVMDKGFALDLSGDAAVAEASGRWYPFIRDALTEENAVYGVPVAVGCDQWCYSLDAWDVVREQFPVEVPQDYHEFIMFVDWWIKEGQYEFPEITLVRGTLDAQLTLTSRLTELLLDLVWRDGAPEYLLDPGVLAVFQALQEVPFASLQAPVASDGGEGCLALFSVAQDWADLTQYPDEPAFLPLPLAISDGLPLAVPVELRVFFVNPGSAMREEAVAYVACFLEGQDERYAIAAYDGPHPPVENPWSPGSWLVTEERVATYQQLTALFFARGYNPLLGQLDDAMQSFMQGKTSAEGFLRGLCSAVDMALGEAR